jgi:hypothetical protein
MRGQAATQTAARFGRRWAVCSVPLNGWPPRYLQPGGSPPLTRRVAAPLLVCQQHQEAQTVSHSRPRRPHLVHWRAPPSAGGLTGNKHATQTRRHRADVSTMYPDPLILCSSLHCSVTTGLRTEQRRLRAAGDCRCSQEVTLTAHCARRLVGATPCCPTLMSSCHPLQQSPNTLLLRTPQQRSSTCLHFLSLSLSFPSSLL